MRRPPSGAGPQRSAAGRAAQPAAAGPAEPHRSGPAAESSRFAGGGVADVRPSPFQPPLRPPSNPDGAGGGADINHFSSRDRPPHDLASDMNTLTQSTSGAPDAAQRAFAEPREGLARARDDNADVASNSNACGSAASEGSREASGDDAPQQYRESLDEDFERLQEFVSPHSPVDMQLVLFQAMLERQLSWWEQQASEAYHEEQALANLIERQLRDASEEATEAIREERRVEEELVSNETEARSCVYELELFESELASANVRVEKLRTRARRRGASSADMDAFRSLAFQQMEATLAQAPSPVAVAESVETFLLSIRDRHLALSDLDFQGYPGDSSDG